MAAWSDAEFDAFVGARMGSLVRFAYSLTGDLGVAEDLVQTVPGGTHNASGNDVACYDSGEPHRG